MIKKTKYISLVLNKGLANNQETANLLVDTLYQLAHTVVQNYLNRKVGF